MSTKTVFKLVFKDSVRRVEIENENITFASFLNVINKNIPEVTIGRFNVQWRDDEDDIIVVSSTDELKEAFRVMAGLVPPKLARFIVNECAPTAAPAAPTAPTATAWDEGEDKFASLPSFGEFGEETVVHEGVQCDRCDKCPITGIRFKCTTRSDFDLCEDCEAAEPQPYPMLKIVDPTQAPAVLLYGFGPHARRGPGRGLGGGCPLGRGCGRGGGRGGPFHGRGAGRGRGPHHMGHHGRGHPAADVGAAVHRGIVCDGCRMAPIVGPRYKCTVRQDYDLCESCEQRDNTGFPMIYISQPQPLGAFAMHPPHPPHPHPPHHGGGMAPPPGMMYPPPGMPLSAYRHAHRVGRGGVDAAEWRHAAHDSHCAPHSVPQPPPPPFAERGELRRAAVAAAAAATAAARAKKVGEPISTTDADTAANLKEARRMGIHRGFSCDGCGMRPIVGDRYHCSVRPDYDLCEGCEAKGQSKHALVKISATTLKNQLPQWKAARDVAAHFRCAARAQANSASAAAHRSPFVAAMDSGASTATATATAVDGVTTDKAEVIGRVNQTLKPTLRFVRHRTFPDGTRVSPGTVFNKTWLVRNEGPGAWPEGAVLCSAGGDQLSGQPIKHAVPQLEQWGELELTIQLQAPEASGRFVAYFRMQTADGQNFGQRLWADIVVDELHEVQQESDWQLIADFFAGAANGGASTSASEGVPTPVTLSRQHTDASSDASPSNNAAATATATAALEQERLEAIQEASSSASSLASSAAASTASVNNSTVLVTASDAVAPDAADKATKATKADPSSSSPTVIAVERTHSDILLSDAVANVSLENLLPRVASEPNLAVPPPPPPAAAAVPPPVAPVDVPAVSTLKWQHELRVLGDMGFHDIDALVPLLEKHIPEEERVRRGGPRVEGLQAVVGELLLTASAFRA